MDPRVADGNYRSIIYRNNPNAFKTTYGTSYTDVPTFYVSPRYEDFRKYRNEQDSRDLSPYRNRGYSDRNYDYFDGPPDDRYEMERRDRDYREMERRESPFRNRLRDESPFREPLSHRSRYDQEIDRRNGFQEGPMSYRNGEVDERPSPRQQNTQDERIRPDLRPGELTDNYGDEFETDRPPRFCNRCFVTKVCINKFKCGHQYCDQCLKKLKGAENPFRGAWLWHFKCGICKTDEWCSEQRLVRYDAKGRRIERYRDVKYFET